MLGEAQYFDGQNGQYAGHGVQNQAAQERASEREHESKCAVIGWRLCRDDCKLIGGDLCIGFCSGAGPCARNRQTQLNALARLAGNL